MSEQTDPIPPCLIFIDKEGRWYHQGAEMLRREFIKLFYSNMELDSEGRYLINWGDTSCHVEVEDTAFVVTRVSPVHRGGHRPAQLRVRLTDGTEEALAPETLSVGKDHVLYCRVKSGAFPARFNRASYYQLAEFIEEYKGAFFLCLNSHRHPLREDNA